MGVYSACGWGAGPIKYPQHTQVQEQKGVRVRGTARSLYAFAN